MKGNSSLPVGEVISPVNWIPIDADYIKLPIKKFLKFSRII